MEFIGSVITVIFVAIIIGTALTLGGALLLTIIGVSILMMFFFLLRGYFMRWRFVHNAEKRENEAARGEHITIIETDYEDMTDKK